MRVIWLLGGAKTHIQQLAAVLSEERTGLSFLVRHAEELSDIPEPHLLDPGTVILVDAFHPEYVGFAGLEALSDLRTQARCFLLGEPAREQATMPFEYEFFCGFLPSLDRCDFSFLGGIIQSTLFGDADRRIAGFLAASGKVSSEEITDLPTFSKFEKLLGTFVSRFGIEPMGLKKLLMGITLQHAKSESGKINIDAPYTIDFGLDPQKLVVGVSTMSRGNKPKELHAEFVKAVGSVENVTAASSSMFPEFHHSVRANPTLLFFYGSAKSAGPSAEPCYLLSRLTFPLKNGQPTLGSGYCYVSASVFKTEEKTEEWAQMVAEDKGDEGEAQTQDPVSSPAATSLHDILQDPAVSGDAVEKTPKTVSASPDSVSKSVETSEEVLVVSSKSPSSASAVGVAPEKYRLLDQSLHELNKVCAALSNDVHRLMKQRREPSTDRELRASKEKLEKKLKKLTIDLQKATTIVANKDQEIEELQQRVKRLMSQAA